MNKPILVRCFRVWSDCCTWRNFEFLQLSEAQTSSENGSGEVSMFAGLLTGIVFACVLVAGSSYLIYGGERGAWWGKGVVDEEEERFLRSQRHTLSNKEAQLPHWKEEGAETKTPRSVSEGDTPKFHSIWKAQENKQLWHVMTGSWVSLKAVHRQEAEQVRVLSRKHCLQLCPTLMASRLVPAG